MMSAPSHDRAADAGEAWSRRLDIALANAVPIVAILAYALSRAFDDGVALASGSVSGQVRDLLWFALICGFAAYATIEVLKRVLRVRGWYQRWQTTRWLDEDAYRQLRDALGLKGDEALRFFNLPTEQLAAQIGAAADIALAHPAQYEPLVRALAAPVPEELVKRSAAEAARKPGESKVDRDAQLELAQRMRLGIDRLQISLSEQWRRTVQGGALWVAGLYGIGLVHAGDRDVGPEARYILAAMLLGGPLAWLMRDVAAIAERARR